MTRTVVGVLRGGNSNEYDLSLKSGASVIAALPQERYDVRDILIDRRGLWHMRGIPTEPIYALRQLDVAVNALHGGIGEDGTVPRFLETIKIPYTGSRPLSAAFSLHKARARELLASAHIKVPQAQTFTVQDSLDTAQMARIVFAKFAPPYVIKPLSMGSSHGIRLARTVYELPDALGDVLDAFGGALVEEFVRGHEVTVGVIQNFRNEPLYTLPPTDVRFKKHPNTSRIYFGWNEDTSHHAPSTILTQSQKHHVADMARRAHTALGLGHYSRGDFIVAPHGAYLLEVNALPALHAEAPFAVALDSVGSSLTTFLEHIISEAQRQPHGRTF